MHACMHSLAVAVAVTVPPTPFLGEREKKKGVGGIETWRNTINRQLDRGDLLGFACKTMTMTMIIMIMITMTAERASMHNILSVHITDCNSVFLFLFFSFQFSAG